MKFDEYKPEETVSLAEAILFTLIVVAFPFIYTIASFLEG